MQGAGEREREGKREGGRERDKDREKERQRQRQREKGYEVDTTSRLDDGLLSFFLCLAATRRGRNRYDSWNRYVYDGAN